MNNLIPNTNGNLAKMASYAKKTLELPFRPKELSKSAPRKTLAPSLALSATITGILTDCKSASQIEQRLREINSKLGKVRSESRSSLGNLLDEERTLDWLSERLLNFLFIAHRMRLLKTEGSEGLVIAFIDGLDLGEVHRDGGKCDLCIERKHSNGEVRYFHKVVVISVNSSIGPIPICVRFVRPSELTVESSEVSDEKFKQECELSCAKKMLLDLAGKMGGRLPFDILASDSLYANAPFMEQIEALGALGIFVFKQENRKLHQQAKADFCGDTFGFGVIEHAWEQLEPKPRTFICKWSTYRDKNRKGENKNVRVFETKRTETSGTEVTGMALTSDHPVITPELVEFARFGKWHDLENGVFNDLANQWGTLKHIFFHKTKAIQSMIVIQFICLIVTLLYRYRNLTRGGRRHRSTLKEFLGKMLSDLRQMSKATLLELFCNSPPIKY